MKITLVHPPLDDPTAPYHSTAYLRGHLARNGFLDVSTRDLNIEFVNYCLEEHVGRTLYEEVERRLVALRAKAALTPEEQGEYYALWAASSPPLESVRSAAAALRDKAAFLDHEIYLESVRRLEGFCGTLAALSYPANIANFKLRCHGRYSIYNLDDLFNPELCGRICHPIELFFYDRCIADPELLESDCIGISIVYDHQLLTALHLARLVKRRWPHKLLLLGGTSVSQCYKYLRDKLLLKRFFEICDGIVIGEGETAMCEVAAADGDLTRATIPNLITYDARADLVRLPSSIHYEHVATLGRPIYRHPWELYLAPERAINYSPTRGCYWNRCTFCDYGLNTDKPTSPWRERPVTTVIEDLKQIQDEEGVRYVYFAVDVMAPGYLERLADALAEAKLDIRWSAEVRMEKIFSKERCRKMAKSGCVSISFGMESGNQRILDLIDKGTKVGYMGETMTNFAEAGIAVQLMAFSHFPTETAAERRETMSFVEAHRQSWSAGGMGTFVLTGTALVAKAPEKFGVRLMETQGADIRRALAFEARAAGERNAISAEEGDDSFDGTRGVFPASLGRPWAGSIDSLHSMIYYHERGRTVFKDLQAASAMRRADEPGSRILDSPIDVNGKLSESDFAIDSIFAGRVRFRDNVMRLQQAAVEPTYQEFLKWQRDMPALGQDNTKSYWLVQDGRCLRIPEAVYPLLLRASTAGCPLNSLLRGFSQSSQQRLAQYFLLLAEKGCIRIRQSHGTADLPVHTHA